MLSVLRVRQLAIIDELEVVFGPGLNVLTGETGAGKSILVDALQLVLGGRGRPEMVRTGAPQAEVEALFDVGDDPVAIDRLRAAGIETEGGELIVRRVVSAQGRTRAYVNGTMATQAQLAELAAGMADISSQHEHHTLVDPATHLGYLDAFGRLEGLRGEVGEAFRALEAADRALAEAQARVKGRGEREDVLRFQIKEIDDLSPRPGELAALAEERERLRYAEKLVTSAGAAEDAIYARDGAICEELSSLAARLSEAADIDARLAPMLAGIEAARAQLEEAARDLGQYARDVTMDPERLAEADERLHRLTRLAKKYAGNAGEGAEEAILAQRDHLATELAELDSAEERIAELEAARAKALAKAGELAKALSKKRHDAASKLGTAISTELASLGMGGAKVSIHVARLEGGRVDGARGELSVDGSRLSAGGIDRAEFLISPNKGEEARPLRKVASGGELSRAMLAIKRVLAGLGPAGLYVFDEVDTGVGGAVAEVIGRKLKEVARHHQVLCVTHLAPIAVYADRHFLVRKDVVGERTRSAILALDEGERLEEVARMLGGLNITKKTRDAAAELLRGARA
ncbi:DNA repair protein RecN [Sandaracinus amylolyticus]|uniref:DNA repair protein RecN n=1 Tax=Sandaracinus amylolyticus TaxID=927083 RepID=A0A0F6W5H8_9BACT|nr:DNA repair protein RecN [Sandaracinus amylolyticus]AKF07833.1 DNA repair protein RecN [Sandaracinus amylolyticus]